MADMIINVAAGLSLGMLVLHLWVLRRMTRTHMLLQMIVFDNWMCAHMPLVQMWRLVMGDRVTIRFTPQGMLFDFDHEDRKITAEVPHDYEGL
jgi:hypothetical protein